MAEEEMALSMAEGEMDIDLFGQKIHTKGFRMYSILLLSMLGLFIAVAVKSSEIAVISNVVTFLLGVFTGKKA
jgi:hypothetical protein